MPEWTFLTNYALVLSHIAKNPSITALDISRQIGITERATRKIIADLLQEKYIYKEKEGRCNRYWINPELTLRHESHKEVVVGDFLELLGWDRETANTFG